MKGKMYKEARQAWDESFKASNRKGGDRFAHAQAMGAAYQRSDAFVLPGGGRDKRKVSRRLGRRAAAKEERDRWLRANGRPAEPSDDEVEVLGAQLQDLNPPSGSKAQYYGITKRSLRDEALRWLIERPPGNRPVLVNEDGSVINRREAEELGFISKIVHVASRSTIARLEHYLTRALHHLPLGQRLHRKVQDFNVSLSLLERDRLQGVEEIMLFLTEAPIDSIVEGEGGVIESMIMGGGKRVLVVPNIRAAHGGGGEGGSSEEEEEEREREEEWEWQLDEEEMLEEDEKEREGGAAIELDDD